MKKILEFIWHGCWHHWRPSHTVRLVDKDVDIGTRYVYRCEKCHRIRVQDVV